MKYVAGDFARMMARAIVRNVRSSLKGRFIGILYSEVKSSRLFLYHLEVSSNELIAYQKVCGIIPHCD